MGLTIAQKKAKARLLEIAKIVPSVFDNERLKWISPHFNNVGQFELWWVNSKHGTLYHAELTRLVRMADEENFYFFVTDDPKFKIVIHL